MASSSDLSIDGTDDARILHASCVQKNGRAVLLVGASGRGKSSLALQLMALGASLVSDDRTRLWVERDVLLADAPETIRGMIEARGVGILNAKSAGPSSIELVIDLDHLETDRLPHPRETVLLGKRLPLIHALDQSYFPAAVLQLLCFGRKS